MIGKERFTARQILDIVLSDDIHLILGSLLDSSEVLRRELAFYLQTSIPRYRMKRSPKNDAVMVVVSLSDRKNS